MVRRHYFLVPFVVLAVAILGTFFARNGLGWYAQLTLPPFTPPGWTFSIAWAVIFPCCIFSAIKAFNRIKSRRQAWTLTVLFLINGVLNVLWTWLFFSKHQTGLAVYEAGMLYVTVMVLVVFLWPISRRAALLLIPYGLWTIFAIYLAFAVWKLNA